MEFQNDTSQGLFQVVPRVVITWLVNKKGQYFSSKEQQSGLRVGVGEAMFVRNCTPGYLRRKIFLKTTLALKCKDELSKIKDAYYTCFNTKLINIKEEKKIKTHML